LTADSDDNKGHNSDSAAFAKGSHHPGQQDSNIKYVELCWAHNSTFHGLHFLS
jgi:hypothetical protein